MTGIKPGVISNRTTPEYFFREGCHISEWLNSENDAEVSIARARVEPGVTTRLHRLDGITERYVIIEGRGRVRIAKLKHTEIWKSEHSPGLLRNHT